MSEQPEEQQGIDQGSGQTLGQAVEHGTRRLRRIWPRQIDGPDITAEYRRVLRQLGTAEAVHAAVDHVIDTHGDPTICPLPSALRAAGRDHLAAHPKPTAEPRFVPSAADPKRLVVIYPDGRRIPPGARTVEDRR